MTAIPDFTKINFALPAGTSPASGENWETPEGIAVKPGYGPADTAG
ncbi:MAG: hypothetical protein HKN05_17695, partial [Rhizobiales bacterium]|nr:hypothetical protein [Hyphomicrobiales bacterium]